MRRPLPLARHRLAPSVAMVTLLVVLPVALLSACQPAPPSVEPTRAVRAAKVSLGTSAGVHEYAAEVRARTESRLGFRVGGKLVRRHVDLGASVRRGQPLAQLDPQDLRLGADAAQAALRAAQASHDLSAAEVARYKDLREQGFIGSLELERREAALKAARAQWEQAKAQAGVQGHMAGYATLVADAAGVITAVEAEPGAVVAAGTPVLRLAHDGPRDVVFSVPEDQVGLVRAVMGKPGALDVRLWGDGQPAARATVRELAAAADAATRTFQVKADLVGTGVRLGQTASVRLELPRRSDVIKLPLAAVSQAQGKPVVWLLDEPTMTVRPVPVQVAGADGNSVVIAAGLQPGQTVVTAGVHVLTPGQKVRRYIEPGTAPDTTAAPMPASGASAASR